MKKILVVAGAPAIGIASHFYNMYRSGIEITNVPPCAALPVLMSDSDIFNDLLIIQAKADMDDATFTILKREQPWKERHKTSYKHKLKKGRG